MKETQKIHVYLFMTYENLLNVLFHNDLKLCLPEESNDPFEFMVADEGETSIVKAFRETAITYGFLSFCSNFKSPVMWSHYADKHKGVCLEFEFPYTGIDNFGTKKWYTVCHKHEAAFMHHEDEKQGIPLCEVDYSLERIAFPTRETLFLDALKKTNNSLSQAEKQVKDTLNARYVMALLRKDSLWSYEEEKRIIFSLKDVKKIRNEMFFIEGFNKYIKRIFLGIKCSRSVEKTQMIIDSSRSSDALYAIQVLKMKPTKSTFEVEINDPFHS